MNRGLVAVLAVFLATATGAAAQEQAPRAAAGVPAQVNLNSATVPQLEALPGIGRATAERIVEYRQKNGGFKRAEDLMNVRGIGEKGFLKLKPLVTVASVKSERAAP